MKKKVIKEIQGKISVLTMYFLGKIIFNEMSEFDRIAFKGYARMGKEKFIGSLPAEKMDPIMEKIKEVLGSVFSPKIKDFFLNILYVYSLSSEKKEFEVLLEFYTEYLDEISELQSDSIKAVLKDKKNSRILSKSFKQFDSKAFVSECMADPENILGKVFKVGIRNNFFTQEDLVEFYSIEMKAFSKK